MKTSRFGVDLNSDLEDFTRAVKREVAEVYRSGFSEDAFRRVEARLDSLMREVGDDETRRSIVQGGYNDLAHARVLADANRS